MAVVPIMKEEKWVLGFNILVILPPEKKEKSLLIILSQIVISFLITGWESHRKI